MSFPPRLLEAGRVLGGLLAARWLFTRFRDRAQLASWQRRRLAAHLCWTARQSPFYGEAFARNNADPADLGAWPRMDKATMTANLPALLTRPVDVGAARALARGAMAARDFAGQLPGGVTAGLSSGTTGPAALFLVSARERAAWAGLALARVLRGSPTWRREPARVAFFLRANSPLYETVGGRRRAVRFAYFDLLAPLAGAFPALERLAPTTLVAPPGALRILAAARVAGELRIAPRQVVSVAETLDADDRAAVEAAFHVRVDEVYQATEGFLAATCPAGALHWNEDVVHVEREPLGDGDGRYAPVLTDFRRRLQPFIRYRLDDVVTDEPDDAPPCPCGSVFRRIRRVEGRQDDVLQLPRRDGGTAGVGPLFPDFARLAVAGAAPAGLTDFRVRQTGPDTLGVSLRPGPACDVAPEEFLRRLETLLAADCARAGLRTPTCRLVPWPEPDPGAAGGKRRRVVGLGAGSPNL